MDGTVLCSDALLNKYINGKIMNAIYFIVAMDGCGKIHQETASEQPQSWYVDTTRSLPLRVAPAMSLT